MASNIYTAKMKTVTDTSTSMSSKSKTIKTKKASSPKPKTSTSSQKKSINKKEIDVNKKLTDNDENEENTSTIKKVLDSLKTTVTIDSKGKTPSGLDVEDKAKESEKSSVTVKNDKGEIDFIFWSANKPTEDDVINYLVKSYEKSNNIKDKNVFAKSFGFEGVSEERLNSAFDGYKKMIGIFSQMFTEDEIESLKTGNIAEPKEEKIKEEEPKEKENPDQEEENNKEK